MSRESAVAGLNNAIYKYDGKSSAALKEGKMPGADENKNGEF